MEVKTTQQLLESAVVKKYKLVAGNGRPIRIATKVILEDGREFPFLDILTKKEALRNVESQLSKISIDGSHLVIRENQIIVGDSKEIAPGLYEHNCNRCSHRWYSKNKKPKRCAQIHCRSPYWNKARVMKTSTK